MTRPTYRQIAAVALLLAGIALRFTAVHFAPDLRLLLTLAVILVISAIWPLSSRITATCDRIDQQLRQHPLTTAIIIAAIVLLHLFFQAHRFRDDLYLKFHDEFVYMIQAHMLAHGRLWLAPYPADVRDFFGSFYLIVDRVYAGMYSPGTAILMLPGIWLGLAHWIMPTLAATAASAFFYLILAELFGPVRAIVGVFLLVGLTLFMSMSFMVLSETPLLLAQLICLWSWLHWRKNQKAGWLLLLGAAAGYGAITRPVDMFCVALAIGIAIAFELRRNPANLLKTAGLIVIAALPFLAIQVVQNIGITGKWNQTPLQYYTNHNYPAPILGFQHVTATNVPPTNSLIKKTMMKQWILPAYEEHWRSSLWGIWYPSRIDTIVHYTLPNSLLLILIPLSLMSLREIRRATIIGAMLLFFAIYTADAIFLRHYCLAIAPAMICLILMAWESLERAFPGARSVILTFMLLTLSILAIHALPEFNPGSAPLGTSSADAQITGQIIGALPPRPALVLIQYDPKSDSYDADLAYNPDVAWPDDALTVRASDRGDDENLRIYRYYAQHGQDRDVYLYNRTAARNAQNPLTPLGTTQSLAAQHASP
jgi:hypothetical protein